MSFLSLLKFKIERPSWCWWEWSCNGVGPSQLAAFTHSGYQWTRPMTLICYFLFISFINCLRAFRKLHWRCWINLDIEYKLSAWDFLLQVSKSVMLIFPANLLYMLHCYHSIRLVIDFCFYNNSNTHVILRMIELTFVLASSLNIR